jgi:hypothetical protein
VLQADLLGHLPGGWSAWVWPLVVLLVGLLAFAAIPAVMRAQRPPQPFRGAPPPPARPQPLPIARAPPLPPLPVMRPKARTAVRPGLRVPAVAARAAHPPPGRPIQFWPEDGRD